jgi:pyridoxal/pyridoxine/pyridoxamine kinase
MALPKFDFDTEFRGAGDVVSNAARGRLKKTLTEDELDQLRADAHSEGLKSGETRALEAVAQGVKETAAVIRQTLAQTQRDIEKVLFPSRSMPCRPPMSSKPCARLFIRRSANRVLCCAPTRASSRR